MVSGNAQIARLRQRLAQSNHSGPIIAGEQRFITPLPPLPTLYT